MWFSLGSSLAYAWEQQWGEKRFQIESDGRMARVTINGTEIAYTACGVRLITSQTGKILGTIAIE
jgi:hypothetical protein